MATTLVQDAVQEVGRVLLVNVFGGILCGSSIGFIPVYLVVHSALRNCDAYTDVANCPSAFCEVHNSTSLTEIGRSTATCTFPATRMSGAGNQSSTTPSPGELLVLPCSHWTSEPKCAGYVGYAPTMCHWQHGGLTDEATCVYRHGYTPIETGIIAGALILGAVFGSAAAGVLTRAVGTLKGALVLASIALVFNLVTIVAFVTDSYGAMVAARIGVGFGVGLGHVLCPLIVNNAVRVQLRGFTSAVFQASFLLGVALPATIGALIAPWTSGALLSEHRLLLATWLLIAVPLAASVALAFVVAVELRDSSKRDGGGAGDGRSLHSISNAIASGSASSSSLALASVLCRTAAFRKCCAVAFCLAAAQQLTGINAVLTYAPAITHSILGIEGLRGACLISWWNTMWTLVSVPFARKLPKRRLYLGGLTCVTVALVMAAIATFPAVGSSGPEGRQTVGSKVFAGLGLAVYIAAFQFGMGSMFWTLAAEIFAPPGPGRAVGTDGTSLLLGKPTATSPGVSLMDRRKDGSSEAATTVNLDDDGEADTTATDPTDGVWAMLPADERKTIGCSVTNTLQLSNAMLLVLAYPSMAKGFAGDHGARQGLAGAMLLFGSIAVVAGAALFAALHPPEASTTETHFKPMHPTKNETVTRHSIVRGAEEGDETLEVVPGSATSQGSLAPPPDSSSMGVRVTRTSLDIDW